MQTINKPSDATAAALREWFTFDTWTVREGLLLLAGIDPHHADSLILDADGSWRSDTNPTWAAIGQPPKVESLDDGPPVIHGLRLALDEMVRLAALTSHWHRRPEHEGMTRATPAHFITWAKSKGLTPSWLTVALDTGIVTNEPASGAPTELPDPQRRLALLRAMGGNVKWFAGKWKITGMGKLMKREQGRARSSEKTIRADLHDAAEEEKSEGTRSRPPPLPWPP